MDHTTQDILELIADFKKLMASADSHEHPFMIEYTMDQIKGRSQETLKADIKSLEGIRDSVTEMILERIRKYVDI